MTLEQAYALSCFTPIGSLGPGLTLVRHSHTGVLGVRKQLQVYDLAVYSTLQAHPVAQVPKILAMGEENGTLTVVEEYINGTTLAALLQTQGPQPPARVQDLGRALCRILAQLHSQQPPVVHRDIKPENLLLDQNGRLWLLDFNVAKHHRPGQGRDTHLLGTEGFAAPEQYGFGASGPAADVYAVGVVLNCLLTGELPTLAPAAGPLAPVIARCLSMEPADRPTATELERLLARPAPAGRTRRQLLPPGFRTGKVWKMLLALLGYGLIFAYDFSVEYDNTDILTLAMYRVALLGIHLSLVAYWADYLGLRRRLCPWKSRWVRALMGIVYSLAIVVGWLAFVFVGGFLIFLFTDS